MPPINSQGSRAGLITTIVVFAVAWLVTLIMLIYSNSQLSKSTASLDTLNHKYQDVASSNALTSEGDVSLINSQPVKEKIAGELQGGNTAVDIALAEIRRLTRDINNTPASNFIDADQAATDAIARADAVLGKSATTQPTTGPSNSGSGVSLVAEIDKLTAALSQQMKTNAAQADALKAVKGSLDTRVASWTAENSELDKKLEEEHKRADEATAQTMEAKKLYETAIGSASTEATKTAAESGKQVLDLQQDNSKLTANLTALNKKVADLSTKLAAVRPDVKNAAIRQADGNLIRVPSSTVCYINLGLGDHLPVGITFEVYDKNEGVPALGSEPQSDNNLPVGKASIEVVRVGQNSSECRVVHMTPGATLAEGDLIANLVYDRNTTFNFVVFGVFDTDGNGVYTAQKADVVRSLVTRWGGKVQKDINADTDFLVIGKEPEIPALTKEEMDDAILKAKFDKAVADSKAYQDVLNRASELHIPVLNQNRFMYYIGYYDQLKR